MNALSVDRKISIATIGSGLLVLAMEIPTIAATFNSGPQFDQVDSFTTAIPRSDGGLDLADIYYPVVSGSSTETFPVALFLQGAFVDKSFYSEFASSVASYGFGVVVPNHVRTLPTPAGPITNLFPEAQQFNDVLSFITAENQNPLSPVAGLFNPDEYALLGHSFGATVGLGVASGICDLSTFCAGFTPNAEPIGGVFYGGGSPSLGGLAARDIPLENGDVPIGLIYGTEDNRFDPPFEGLEARLFSNIQEPPKALVNVIGANHFGITNIDNPPPLNVIEPDTNTPALPQDVAIETIARWSALFLQGAGLGDSDAFDFVFNSGDALDPNVVVISEVPDDTQSVPEPGFGLAFLGLGMAGARSLRRKRQS